MPRALYYGDVISRGHPLNRGLVSEWSVVPWYASGPRWIDLAGRNHGTLTGGPVWSAARGRPGGSGSLAFTPASSQYVALPDLSARVTTSATLALWVRLNTHTPASPNGSWMGAAPPGANDKSYYPYVDGNIYDGTFSSVRKTVGAGLVADRSQWHFVTITADGPANAWTFYQNGQAALTSTVGTFNPPSAPSLGRSFESASGYSYFAGALDAALLYDRALSAGEVARLYAETSRGNPARWNWVRPVVGPAASTGGASVLRGGLLSSRTIQGVGLPGGIV